MQIAFYVNEKKELGIVAARRAAELARCFQAISCVAHKEDAAAEFVQAVDDPYVGTDFILVFGGDGTMLKAAVSAAFHRIPLIGVNAGTLGFLTETEADGLESMFESLLSGKFCLESRPLMEVKTAEHQYYALNDVSVLRTPEGRLPYFEVKVAGDLVDNYHADGFIVSTPTGSTAYSLSAGGPILSPHLGAMILTPICSHSLRNRPVVVSDAEEVLIKCKTDRVGISVDGTFIGAFNGEFEVSIAKSKFNAQFVRLSTLSFYQKLLSKLNQWSK